MPVTGRQLGRMLSDLNVDPMMLSRLMFVSLGTVYKWKARSTIDPDSLAGALLVAMYSVCYRDNRYDPTPAMRVHRAIVDGMMAGGPGRALRDLTAVLYPEVP